MNKDLTIKELITELVQRLNLQYGSIEIKIHDGKWTNYQLTTRVNFNESEIKEFLNIKKD
jgi:hypothetical protein